MSRKGKLRFQSLQASLKRRRFTSKTCWIFMRNSFQAHNLEFASASIMKSNG
jgi:hypothetical protein